MHALIYTYLFFKKITTVTTKTNKKALKRKSSIPLGLWGSTVTTHNQMCDS